MATHLRRPARAGPRPPAKFVVGQRVLFTPATLNPRVAAGAHFTIVRVLPGDAGRPSYRIKGDGESHERIAEEIQLEARALDE